jgi:hypothetical protein
MEKKIFSLNVIEERVGNLKQIIPNILVQSDLIYINCIQHKIDITDKNFKFLDDKKIKIIYLEDSGSESRFIHYNNHLHDSYYFTIDDDILYPLDYSEKLIKFMKKFENKIICCVHGSNLNLDLNSNFYKKRKDIFHFTSNLDKEQKVMIPGVGTSCFYTSSFKLNINNFKTKNMSDPYVSVFAKKQNVDIYSVPRAKMWLKPLEGFGKSIYGNNPHKEIDELIIENFKK